MHRFSSDHLSQATSGLVSTVMGDRTGTPDVVGLLFFFFVLVPSVHPFARMPVIRGPQGLNLVQMRQSDAGLKRPFRTFSV